MSLVRTGAMLIGALIVATILGGILGAAADSLIPSMVNGTPLGPESEQSPVLWTGIALAVIYGANEVRD